MKVDDIHPETPTEFILNEIMKAHLIQNGLLLDILKELKENNKKKGK